MNAFIKEKSLIDTIANRLKENFKRKQDKESIEAERKLFAILDNFPASIHIQAPDHTIPFANRCFRERFGAPEGKKCFEILAYCIAPCEACPTLRSLDIKGTLEWNALSPDGQVYENYAYPLTDLTDFNGPPLVLVLSIDVTERKKAEASIRAAHAELNQIFDTAADGIRLIDKNHNTLRANETFLALAGLSKEEAIGEKCYETFPGPFCRTSNCPMVRIFRGEERVEYDVEKKRRDGMKIPCILTAKPFRNPHGELIGIIEDFKDITDRRYMEEELIKAKKEAEETYLALVSQAKDGVAIIQDEVWKFVNSSMAAIFGFTPQEMVDKPFGNIIADEYRELLIQRYHPRQSGQDAPSFYEAKVQAKDGTMKDVEISAGIVQYQGKPATLAIFRDVTERNKIRSQMATAQRLAHAGSYEWDILTDKMTWSDELCRIMGIASPNPELSLEEEIKKFIHPDDQDSIRRLFEAALRVKVPFEYQHQVIRADGSIRMVQGRAEVTADAVGNPVKITGFIQDITEIKQAEEALRESKVFFSGTLNDMVTYLSVLEPSGKVIFVNNSPLQAAGITKEDVIGKMFYDTHWWSYSEKAKQTIKDDIENCALGKMILHEIEALMSDGQLRWIELSMHPIFNGDGRVKYIVPEGRDITERKQAEADKEQVQARLFQSQKVEAIGILAGGVAHDFNNILTTIQGYTTLALMKTNKEAPLYKDLSQVYRAAGRAADLTRQLLLFSRKQPTKPVSLDLNKTVNNLLAMLHRLIGEDIGIRIDLESNLWPTFADEGTMEQMIMNLAVNARDAMPDGGELTIKTENMSLNEGYAKIVPEARAGNFVRLSVEDTGTGMDQETIGKIFEPFFTTKEVGKGTGLGLSVVYGIVKQHEGWINVYSEPGQGTVFKIYLPASLIEPEEKAKEAIHFQRFQGKGERILLVEDDEAVRELTARLLDENGYVVIEAASMTMALNIFEQEKGNFHLVLSDVVLPDKSGIELVEHILLRQPAISVLMFSGYPNQKSQWETIRRKGIPFIQKPYDLPDMLRLVRKTIESGLQRKSGLQKR
ncbi:MAG: PAS domain S-box protein [bacterium]